MLAVLPKESRSARHLTPFPSPAFFAGTGAIVAATTGVVQAVALVLAASTESISGTGAIAFYSLPAGETLADEWSGTNAVPGTASGTVCCHINDAISTTGSK